jgi:hypothetical protein
VTTCVGSAKARCQRLFAFELLRGEYAADSAARVRPAQPCDGTRKFLQNLRGPVHRLDYREAHSFTRLRHRASEGRGSCAKRQRSGCRQLHKLAVHCYLPRHRSPVAGLGPLQFRFLTFRCTKGASQWSDSTLRHLGRGRLPQRVTVGGKESQRSLADITGPTPGQLSRRLPVSLDRCQAADALAHADEVIE